MEDLLGRGHFGAALREADALKLGDAALAGRYEFIRQEKVSRAQIGVGDRYVLRGDRRNARRFYERALEPDTADPVVREVAEVASRVFDDLAVQRRALIRGLHEDIEKDQFAGWCGRKKTLSHLTILDAAPIRERIFPDFRLEQIFGERPPIDPDPGYLDPLPPESEFVAFPSAVPGAIFRAATDDLVDVDVPPPGVAELPDGRTRASLAFPVVANVLVAKARLFALEEGLNLAGQADGLVPLFRYEHLRDKAKELVAEIQAVESRMLPIQFELDDFAEAMEPIKGPLATQEAELEAVKQRIAELTQALAELAQVEKALDGVVGEIAKIEDECDCDWFCWLMIGFLFIIEVAVIVAFVAALAALAASTAGVAAVLAAGLAAELLSGGAVAGLLYLQYAVYTCDEIVIVGESMRSSLAGVRGAIAEAEAELSHALMTRDILIASINGLTAQLQEAYASNAARVLDAKTLELIQAQYNSLRQSLLTRAQTVARLAQDAFNFERDADARLIKDAYADSALKGYTAAETLLHDLGGLEHIDLTGRTRKAMQLSQMVSLRKHNPISFVALAATGRGRFTTQLRDFDRWYPGTYLQRIKEVRVEVLVDGEATLVRGYLANDGVSLVRFADSENKRRIDGVRVFAEPDKDLAKLCYKRLQRRRHADTMAFPAFESDLYDARMRRLQERERNFFENVGLESTWLIEILPDQPFDLTRITDIRLWFQYEALFDENLKRVLEPKRYAGRREMVALPIARLLREGGGTADISGTLACKTSRALFDAPAIEKTIVHAGFAVRLKEAKPLGGAAGLEATYDGAPPVALTTTDAGIVATADDHPAGTGLAELAAMVQGKSVDGTWTIKLASLPAGLGPDDVDEIFLLLNCEYTP
jgi:hypothetical protein